MTRSAILGLVVIVLGGAAALGWWLWDSNPGPDRTAVIRPWLVNSVMDPEGLEVLKCKHVKAKFLDRLRQKYPTLELVDCTFRHKDGLGNMVENTHHFWILDEKIIHVRGLTFFKARQGETDAELEAVGESLISQHMRSAEGRGARARAQPAGADQAREGK
jgi:hypothetical protein